MTFRVISPTQGLGHSLLRFAHRRRLECETGPDFNRPPPLRIGGFVGQLLAALSTASLSGGDDSQAFVLQISHPVLGSGSVKVH